MREEKNMYEDIERQLPTFTSKLKSTIHVPPNHPMYSTYFNDAFWKFVRGYEIAHKIDTEIYPLSGKIVFDIGAGVGGIAAGFASFGACVVSADVAVGFIDLARTAYNDLKLKIDCIYGCGEYMSIKDEKVDIAIAYNIFEHVKNLKMLIKERARILKPNGIVLVRADYRLDMRNIRKDPHYGLPLIILLPLFLRKIVVCNLFRRSTELEDYYWVKNYKEVERLFKRVNMKTRPFCGDVIAYKPYSIGGII